MRVYQIDLIDHTYTVHDHVTRGDDGSYYETYAADREPYELGGAGEEQTVHRVYEDFDAFRADMLAMWRADIFALVEQVEELDRGVIPEWKLPYEPES